MSGIEELLSREPKILPELEWIIARDMFELFDFVASDTLTQGYMMHKYIHHPKMKFEVKA